MQHNKYKYILYAMSPNDLKLNLKAKIDKILWSDNMKGPVLEDSKT
jgi:hypothetical protein